MKSIHQKTFGAENRVRTLGVRTVLQIAWLSGRAGAECDLKYKHLLMITDTPKYRSHHFPDYCLKRLPVPATFNEPCGALIQVLV